MITKYGDGKTKYGPGVLIELTAEEVCLAISAYLKAHNTHIHGSRTIKINGELIEKGSVYVDPSGFVISHDAKFSGSEEVECKKEEESPINPKLTKWEIGEKLIEISDIINEKIGEISSSLDGSSDIVELQKARAILGDVFNRNNDHDFWNF